MSLKSTRQQDLSCCIQGQGEILSEARLRQPIRLVFSLILCQNVSVGNVSWRDRLTYWRKVRVMEERKSEEGEELKGGCWGIEY